MRHKLGEKLISGFPGLYWRFKTKAFLNDPWQKQIFPQHDWLVKEIKRLKPQSILEAGCGFGRNLSFLIQQGINPDQLTGFDLSAHLLGQSSLPPEVKLIQANVLRPGLKAGSFELVFTHGLLMHLSPRQVGRGFRELLKLSRKYLILIEEVRPQPGALSYFAWAHDYLKLIRQSNLKVIKSHLDAKLQLLWLLIKK